MTVTVTHIIDVILTSFCPIVTSAALAENEVVGTEKMSKRAGTDRVHGSGFEINQDRARNVLVGTNLIVVD